MDGRGVKMAPEKTEALLATGRRSFQYSRIVLGKHEVEWKISIKYLGVLVMKARELDGRRERNNGEGQ